MSILKLIFFSHSPQRFISYCLANNNISMILPTNDYETLIETAESVGFNLSSFSETWKRITVDEGPLGFDEPGIADSIASPLARINISIYYISTFDTDHLLVKYKDSDKAIDELLKNSFLISQNNFN